MYIKVKKADVIAIALTALWAVGVGIYVFVLLIKAMRLL